MTLPSNSQKSSSGDSVWGQEDEQLKLGKPLVPVGELHGEIRQWQAQGETEVMLTAAGQKDVRHAKRCVHQL
jgi:hypothetical protein